eukprot:GHVU01140207.1.p1 GENE.GHVU01140207.1~~GHVU01140207.1.p1  ORF type:complete len:420 (+),score=58.81 GHVU01140207.1:67-1326(+)
MFASRLLKPTTLRRSCGVIAQRRWLHLHEYQSLCMLNHYNVPVPQGTVARTVREAKEIAENLPSDSDYVVKAQILAGGRGLGKFKDPVLKGGVHICSSVLQTEDMAKKMLNNTLVTRQTGPQGHVVNALYVCERVYIRQERYLAVLMDRLTGGPILIGSSVGGTSIEDIAEETPDAITRLPFDITEGLKPDAVNGFVKAMGISDKNIEGAEALVHNLWRMFQEKDCLLIEINPLAELADGRLLACDAKVQFDDNAEFRQKSTFEMRNDDEEDPREVAARKVGLNYVGLDGNIGCMVNGAGLAMATNDMIAAAGGEASNFLDVGGGATGSQVVEALRILQNDSQVDAIFINIFGGIMRCDTIALGIIAATQEVGLSKPLVVRLEGTKMEEARAFLEESGEDVLSALSGPSGSATGAATAA